MAGSSRYRWPCLTACRAFRHRDYRLCFAGQGISQTGTWLQLIATSWLIYHLSGSVFLLGLAAFALHIPLLVLGPLAGVWVDRQLKLTPCVDASMTLYLPLGN